MRVRHDYLATAPFDVYTLHLFRLVVELGSFTKAGRRAGLTQSALTRQVQNMEAKLGLTLLERTTRTVRPTAAGQFLLEQSAKILGEVELSLTRLREEFGGAPKTVRVGVSRSISLAYLPGFFFAYKRQHPEVQVAVQHGTGAEILAALEAREVDVGILCPPARLPAALTVTHRFADEFTAIVPAGLTLPAALTGNPAPLTPAALGEILAGQRWLLLDTGSNTGRQLRTWMQQAGLTVQPAMELDGFDLVIHLVGLGLGVSLVPRRALALYGGGSSGARSRQVRRLALTPRFRRELVVVTAKERPEREHVAQFAKSVLF